MKNIPRIFIEKDLNVGDNIEVSKDISHYLTHVMRRKDCLIFNKGKEFTANLSDDNKKIIVIKETNHQDPSNNITLYFSPIKRLDDLLNMATQMGVKTLQPVITERTTANHINWERMKKIICEASEQSNRNSIPELLAPINFSKIDFADIAFADERAAYGKNIKTLDKKLNKVLIGPEGGFSDKEFETLDNKGATSISLGKTILRAELAAAIAISRLINYEN